MVHSLNFVQPSLQMKNSSTSPEQKWSLKRLGKSIYLVLSPMMCACYLNNYLETCVTLLIIWILAMHSMNLALSCLVP